MEVAALWRYPIKSHGREALERVTLKKGLTMPWDRTWAVTHEATKFDRNAPGWVVCRNFMTGARTPKLAGISAELDDATRQITLHHAERPDITFCPDLPEDIAQFVEWVRPLCPEDRAAADGIVSAHDRGMTDSPFPSISIMNMASHDAVQNALPSQIEHARWRGNIWVNGLEPWAEHEWLGREIKIGGATLKVRERIKRCAVTNTNTHTGVRDTATLDVLNNTFGHQDFGVYAEVIEGGEIVRKDQAVLI